MAAADIKLNFTETEKLEGLASDLKNASNALDEALTKVLTAGMSFVSYVTKELPGVKISFRSEDNSQEAIAAFLRLLMPVPDFRQIRQRTIAKRFIGLLPLIVAALALLTTVLALIVGQTR